MLPQLPGAAVNNDTGMSKSTASGSYQQPDPDADLYEPSAGIELDQEELEEIFSRPFMNPQFAEYGYLYGSNQMLQAEQNAFEQKKEKVFELFKSS